MVIQIVAAVAKEIKRCPMIKFTEPSPKDFIDGCLAYEKNEQRDSMYKVSTFLMENYWGHPAEMADALGVLLSTWNNAFYRYGPFSYEELQAFIEFNWQRIETFRPMRISEYSQTLDDSIAALFQAFLQALRISSGKNEGRTSPVGTAKALHLLGPAFFPIWDDKIAKAYGCFYGKDPPGAYIRFIRISVEMAQRLSPHVHRPDRSIIKLIDEYNYAKYTKQWISQI
jgi:hypothetical protein